MNIANIYPVLIYFVEIRSSSFHVINVQNFTTVIDNIIYAYSIVHAIIIKYPLRSSQFPLVTSNNVIVWFVIKVRILSSIVVDGK